MLPYTQLTIKCETSPSIPPPYSHLYDIVIDENPSNLILSFKLAYTDREGLSEEEILDEGFEPDDDFNWSGRLNKVWKQQLDNLIKGSSFRQAPGGGDYNIYIQSNHNGVKNEGYVGKKEISAWIYFVQEIKQAIFETEQIEVPLTLEYLHIEENSQTHIVLNGEFANRTFTARVGDRPVEQWDWATLQKTINLVFNDTEIDMEKTIPDRPRQTGHYLMIPGAGWYGLGTGIRSRYDDDSTIRDIINAMGLFTGKK